MKAVWEAIHADDRAQVFFKLPSRRELPDYYTEITEPMDLKTIKDKLGRHEYTNLAQFEHDMHLIFDNCKNYNLPRSEIYNDAVALQKLLKKLLKENSTSKGTPTAVAPRVAKDDSSKIDERLESRNYHDALQVNRQAYESGDFVYVENVDDASKPMIVHIHALWTEKGTRNKGIVGCTFLRPEQTFHVPTRKFYPNEVFRTRTAYEHSFDDVVGKCCVLFMRDYVKGRPEGFEDKDVYVCESRYSEVDKAIEPIKNWKLVLPKAQQLKESYHPPLIGEPRKLSKTVPSVFASQATAEPDKDRTTLRLPHIGGDQESAGKHMIRIKPPGGPSDESSVAHSHKRPASNEADVPMKKIRLSIGGSSAAAATNGGNNTATSSPTPSAPTSEGKKGEKEHVFVRWTMQETLVLAQALTRHGTDWSKVYEDCYEICSQYNHDSPQKLRERYRLLNKNMPPGANLEEAILSAIEEKVEESVLSAWLADYWRRPGVLPEAVRPSKSAAQGGASPSNSPNKVVRCNFPDCARKAFASNDELFAHIRSTHLPEFRQAFTVRSRSNSYGTFVKLKDQVPPTYINDEVLSKEFVDQYVSTSNGKLVWYSRPPLDVLPPQASPVHSEVYVKFKGREAEATAKEAQEMREFDLEQHRRYTERVEKVTTENWRSLWKTLLGSTEKSM